MSVAKLTSATSASVAKKKITQRGGPGFKTVNVTLLDFGVSLGEVQVKDGTKVIAAGATDGAKTAC